MSDPQPPQSPQPAPYDAPAQPAPYDAPAQPGYWSTAPAAPPTDPAPAEPALAAPGPERVGRGVLLALLAIPVGMVAAGLIWQAGFIASVSTLLMAALAPALYRRGSGGRIQAGIPVVVAVIVVGAVLSFFAVVTTDLFQVYADFTPAEAAGYGSRLEFWASNIVYGPVLRSYGIDLVLFAVFAVLGALGTVVRLLRQPAPTPSDPAA